MTLDDRLNMAKLKHRLRFIAVLTTVLMMAAAPILQAHQSFDGCNVAYESCGCGCCCGTGEAASHDASSLNGKCCCSVSSPATETKVPLEAKLRPPTNPDVLSTVMPAISPTTVVELDHLKTTRTGQRLAHGPPLYILNASFII